MGGSSFLHAWLSSCQDLDDVRDLFAATFFRREGKCGQRTMRCDLPFDLLAFFSFTDVGAQELKVLSHSPVRRRRRHGAKGNCTLGRTFGEDLEERKG